MNATAIFFLILGQADGFATGDADYGSGLALIPAHYSSLSECEGAGEAAREYNAGLSFLSYTCVPASQNVAEAVCEVPVRHRQLGNRLTPTTASLSAPHIFKPARDGGVK